MIPAWLMGSAGPWLLKAAPFLAAIPAFTTLKSWLRTASYVAVLAIGVWTGAKVLAWWQGNVLTIAEADARAADQRAEAIAAAKVAAKTAALEARERTLAARENEVAADTKRIDAYEKELNDARERLSSDAAPFVDADDSWLWAWRGGKR